MPYLQRYTQIHILEQQKMCCWKQHITGYVRYKKLGQATFFDFCISVKIGPSTPYILESVENGVCLEQTQNRVIDS